MATSERDKNNMRVDRLLQTNMMRCGMACTIIKYRHCDDIDVRFDDQTIVRHKSYNSFQNGSIVNPNFNKRVGFVKMMKCGMRATITKYYCENFTVDVIFDDGTGVCGKSYQSFKNGEIKNESLPSQVAIRHLNESAIMRCGLKATIVAWRNGNDIDIAFENGMVRTHMSYANFLAGGISTMSKEDLAKSRLNQVRHMSCGMDAKVIAYHSATNVDIEFEDGAVRKGVPWKHFNRGKVSHPNMMNDAIADKRLNEQRLMANGMVAKIVQYSGWDNVDVEFSDGAIVNGVRYEHFKNGEVAHPHVRHKKNMSVQEFAIFYYLRNLGFIKIRKGEWEDKGFGKCELDFYHPERNIAIEYDGAIHSYDGIYERELDKNKKCETLGVVLYRLRDPILRELQDHRSINYILDKQKMIMCGLIDCKMELEEILKQNNIDVIGGYIDFNRDKANILREYSERYIVYEKTEKMGLVVDDAA